MPDRSSDAAWPNLGAPPGLCRTCRYAKLNQTRRGTAYLRCTRAEWDPALTRYPRLPVTECAGYEDPSPDTTSATPGGGVLRLLWLIRGSAVDPVHRGHHIWEGSPARERGNQHVAIADPPDPEGSLRISVALTGERLGEALSIVLADRPDEQVPAAPADTPPLGGKMPGQRYHIAV